jgi:hypothetical protein
VGIGGWVVVELPPVGELLEMGGVLKVALGSWAGVEMGQGTSKVAYSTVVRTVV